MYIHGWDLILYVFDGEFWKGTTGVDGLHYSLQVKQFWTRLKKTVKKENEQCYIYLNSTITITGKTTIKVLHPCRSGMD